MIKTYPLNSISIDEAKEKQFLLIDEVTKVFRGKDILSLGDLGVVMGLNKPLYTKKVEQALASFFNAEACILIRGAGTGAIRYALHSALSCNDKVLIHTSPIYPTTKTTFEMLGLKPISCDFNDLNEIEKALLSNPDIKGALVQYTRQKIDDSYDMEAVIKKIKSCKDIPIVTDDNYAVMKVAKIGSELGADLACFSTFKLLGPEGIGCIVGKKKYIDNIIAFHYSGGMQVQGHEALAVLKGLIYAPVSLAIQSEENEKLVKKLNSGEITGVKSAFLANAQSKVLIVELEKPNAPSVLECAEKLGAAPYPVGAESKYEFVPMFYRVSGTFKAADPTMTERMIRINPLRSGANTVLRILSEAITQADNQ